MIGVHPTQMHHIATGDTPMRTHELPYHLFLLYPVETGLAHIAIALTEALVDRGTQGIHPSTSGAMGSQYAMFWIVSEPVPPLTVGSCPLRTPSSGMAHGIEIIACPPVGN